MSICRIRTGSHGCKTYFTYRLVRSRRIGAKVRQQTLLNLGSRFPMRRWHWQTLSNPVEQTLDHQPALLPSEAPPSIEAEAQRIAERQLRDGARLRQPASGPEPSQEAALEANIQSVDVDSLQLARPHSVGVEHVSLWAAEQFGLPDLPAAGTGPDRSPAPCCSRRAGRPHGRSGLQLPTWTWLRERSGLGGLLGCDFETTGLSALYRAGDLLLRYREALEARLFLASDATVRPARRVTLIDLTYTCFEGGAKAQPKAKRGRSKEKRSDCPLLTLGMVLDGSGFARRTRFRRNCWRSRAFTAAASER